MIKKGSKFNFAKPQKENLHHKSANMCFVFFKKSQRIPRSVIIHFAEGNKWETASYIGWLSSHIACSWKRTPCEFLFFFWRHFNDWATFVSTVMLFLHLLFLLHCAFHLQTIDVQCPILASPSNSWSGSLQVSPCPYLVNWLKVLLELFCSQPLFESSRKFVEFHCHTHRCHTDTQEVVWVVLLFANRSFSHPSKLHYG